METIISTLIGIIIGAFLQFIFTKKLEESAHNRALQTGAIFINSESRELFVKLHGSRPVVSPLRV